jgi:hypothetical protein
VGPSTSVNGPIQLGGGGATQEPGQAAPELALPLPEAPEPEAVPVEPDEVVEVLASVPEVELEAVEPLPASPLVTPGLGTVQAQQRTDAARRRE